MQIFTVLRSGNYSSVINGKLETAGRVMILGSYSTQAPADRVRDTTPLGEGWDANSVICTWVDTAILDAPPIP